jgi:large subunit ribosomal protein L25
MEQVKIQVSHREEKGKEAVKRLKKQGVIPAVVYSLDTNISLSVPSASLKTLRAINFSESTVINMEITNEKKSKAIPVIIKDIQYHPLTEKVIHLDFLKVSLKEKIKVNVAIILKGESKGVKEAEGTVEQILRELEIEGLPLDIPDKIEVDISHLEIGQSLHVENLAVSSNIKVITEPEITVVTVLAKKEEVEEEVALEGEAASQEPEVIKEKKESDEEGKDDQKEGKPEAKQEDKKDDKKEGKKDQK